MFQGDDRRGDAPTTFHGGASIESTRVDLVSVPRWTLKAHRHECAPLMDLKRFDAMTVYGKIPIVCDRYRFVRDEAIGV